VPWGIATKRLSVDARGRVVYRYKQPFRDGSTHVILEPLDFMFRMNGMPRAQGCAGAAIARLAALVPRPRFNLTRFHGLFAPNCKHRARIVPHRSRGTVDNDRPTAPMSWPLPHIHVLRGTWASCPSDAATEARIRNRYRNLSRAPGKHRGRFARSARRTRCVPISACGGKLRVIAAIEEPPLITKILGHVQRREALTSPPRGPPDSKEALHLT
jgi:hypothetical protein